MTRHFDKGVLWASADSVAGDIYKAVGRGRRMLYTPWFWRLIMTVVRGIPEALFVRFGPR
jgi:short-subunit dehydrogenase